MFLSLKVEVSCDAFFSLSPLFIGSTNTEKSKEDAGVCRFGATGIVRLLIDACLNLFCLRLCCFAKTSLSPIKRSKEQTYLPQRHLPLPYQYIKSFIGIAL